jgi:hypothetical protein
VKDYVEIMVSECVRKAFPNPVARARYYGPWGCAAVNMVVVISAKGGWAKINVNEAQDLRYNERG